MSTFWGIYKVAAVPAMFCHSCKGGASTYSGRGCQHPFLTQTDQLAAVAKHRWCLPSAHFNMYAYGDNNMGTILHYTPACCYSH